MFSLRLNPDELAADEQLAGERDGLGLWVGPAGGEGAKQWMSMLTELRNHANPVVSPTCASSAATG